MMNKPARHLSWVLFAAALFYIVLQGLSSAHAAEFGDLEHTHDGQTCLISSVAQRGDDATLPDLVESPDPDLARFSIPDTRVHELCGVTSTTASARAPPLSQ